MTLSTLKTLQLGCSTKGGIRETPSICKLIEIYEKSNIAAPSLEQLKFPK